MDNLGSAEILFKEDCVQFEKEKKTWKLFFTLWLMSYLTNYLKIFFPPVEEIAAYSLLNDPGNAISRH